MKVRTLRKLADLQPTPRNINRGTPRGASLLDESLEAYGFGRPILADRHGRVLAGSQTLKAILRKAKALGFDLRVVQSRGRAVIVHQREDLAAGDKAANGLALADNRIAQLGFDVDPEVLADMLAEGVAVKEFYFDDELARILKLPVALDGREQPAPPNDGPGEDLPGGVRVVQLPGALPEPVIAPAWQELRRIEAFPSNRSTASVGHSERPITRGGYRSNTGHVIASAHPEVKGVSSAIIGYYDRNPRYPLCRLTAFNMRYPARWQRILPFVRAVDRIFAEAVPERHAAQAAECDQVHPDFRIAGTAFTTMTVNKNWQTLVHRDAGDYRPGFGVLSAFRGGEYSGCLFCYPGFRPRIAVDLRTRDVLLSDVHEWHGNTPLEGLPGRYERVSVVFYMRAKMVGCRSAAEELELARHRRPGDPIYRPEELAGEANRKNP